MLEQLIITLREGVEAALMVAIAIIYLRKIGREDLNRVVYAALGLAFAISLAGAIVMTRLQWNDDRFEGITMVIAGVFVLSMVYWMQKTARHLRHEIEGKIESLVGRTSATGLFLFVFFMVLREGVETVLMLTAVSFNTSELLAWMGSVLGLVLAVLFGVAFVKGAIKVDLRRFFRVTSYILWFIAIQLFITGAHELSEAGVLPASRREMAIIGPIVSNEVFFFIVVLGLAGLLLLRESRMKRAEAAVAAGGGAAGASQPSPAVLRREKARLKREKLWSGLAYGAAFLFIVMFSAEYVYSRSIASLTPATLLTAHNGLVSVPVRQIENGDLHRYKVITPGGPVRFFALRKPNGHLALAFDACQICGGKGYYQNGQMLFCRNCDAPVNTATIGIYGGCNPIPLQYQVVGNQVLIRVGVLAGEAPLFRKS